MTLINIIQSDDGRNCLQNHFAENDLRNMVMLASGDYDLNSYAIGREGLVQLTQGQSVANAADGIREYIASLFDMIDRSYKTASDADRAILRKFCQRFAFDVGTYLGPKFFDRSRISKAVQNILSPRLEELRSEKAAPTFQDSKEHTLKRKIAKAKLAYQLGIRPEKNAHGATGSFVVCDIGGKKLGSYKQLLPTTVKPVIQFWNRSREALGYERQIHFFRDGGAIPSIFSDIAASVADSFFGMELVPGIARVILDAKNPNADGSFMVWKKRVTDARHFQFSENPTASELYEFQKMAILDYFIGNLDRKSDNWLIEEADGHICRITMIDNSNCFIERNPSSDEKHRFARKNQYQWKNLPFAKYPFSNESKLLMVAFTPDQVEQYISQAREQLEAAGFDQSQIDRFLSPEMISHLHERAQIISHMGFSLIRITPENLASYSTEEAISKWKLQNS